jgi:hypothetical protein
MSAIFRPPLSVALLALASFSFALPVAAQYYYQAPDPCRPPTGLLGILDPAAEARAQACMQARDAAIRQRQAEIAAEQARQEEAQRAAEQARAEADARARAVAAAQAAAEASPDNVCRKPEMAGLLIDQYNAMDWQDLYPRRVVDIEHLVTIKNDPDNSQIVCHGVWVHTNGVRLEGTMTMRPNVAGKIIVTWVPGHWEPPVPAARTTYAQTPTSSSSSAETSSFHHGLADRESWENWFAGTSGDYRNGALFWSGQRSLAHPGSCDALGGDATAGCLAAKARLTASDAMRKADSEYRRGWNSFQSH